MGGGEAPPHTISCLLLTTQRDVKFNASAVAKKAECLHANIQALIARVGIERVGFVTLTFSDNVTTYAEASRRFNSFATWILRRELRLEFITVPERQDSGRFHFHLVAAFARDIRSGFNFDAYKESKRLERRYSRNGRWSSHEGEFKRAKRLYTRSANEFLRSLWHRFDDVAPGYKFGYCQILPILSNADALSRYLASYVTSASRNRIPADKGMRTVRYSLTRRAASLKFSWAGGNGAVWRRGLLLLGCIYGLDMDGLKDTFTNKFQYVMREKIQLLGQHYATCIGYVSHIPHEATHGERSNFLARLLDTVCEGKKFDEDKINHEPVCPF